MPELKESYDRPMIYTRAEPDDEYPQPEPLDPDLIEKYQYPEDEDDEVDDDMDEKNYSS